MRIRAGGPGPISGGESPGGQEHKVQKGETLETIAKQYGIAADDLAKSNPQLKNPDKLRAGTRMFIPPFQTQTETPGIAKDTYETAKPKSSLDQMMERPAGQNVPSGVSPRSFHFGKGEAQASKSPGDAQAWGDPHAPTKAMTGEAQSFKNSESLSPGELRAKGDPHVPTKAMSGEAQSFKNSESLSPGELRAKGDPHVPTKVTSDDQAARFLNAGDAQSFKNSEPREFQFGKGEATSQKVRTSESSNQNPTDATAKKLDANQFEIKDGKVIIRDEN